MRPALRERVRMKDSSSVYLVVYVDTHRNICDLIELSDEVRLLEQIPFADLLPEHTVTVQ